MPVAITMPKFEGDRAATPYAASDGVTEAEVDGGEFRSMDLKEKCESVAR